MLTKDRCFWTSARVQEAAMTMTWIPISHPISRREPAATNKIFVHLSQVYVTTRTIMTETMVHHHHLKRLLKICWEERAEMTNVHLIHTGRRLDLISLHTSGFTIIHDGDPTCMTPLSLDHRYSGDIGSFNLSAVMVMMMARFLISYKSQVKIGHPLREHRPKSSMCLI